MCGYNLLFTTDILWNTRFEGFSFDKLLSRRRFAPSNMPIK